jgi:sarcosine oxidase gamma subunit
MMTISSLYNVVDTSNMDTSIQISGKTIRKLISQKQTLISAKKFSSKRSGELKRTSTFKS